MFYTTCEMISLIYTYCLNLCVFFGILEHSRCFVANLPFLQFTRFGVKFWSQKLLSGKSFDKYHVLATSHSRSTLRAQGTKSTTILAAEGRQNI